MARQLPGSAIQANTITTTQLVSSVVTQIQSGGGPRVSSLVYPGDDTAANTVGGQTVYINGSGFASNSSVYINGNAVPSISFISSSNLSITTPALSSSTYPVYVINPETGATAIFVPGLIVSGEPTWSTAAGSLNSSQDAASAWSYSLSATGDAPITYALAAGSSLPSGISLASNGVISGTMSSPPASETTYTFSIVASDAQNQDSTRQFTVTVSTGEGVLFANNVLLIHADGTNNGNNHAFLDSSNNNFTITRYGNSTQGSFSPFSQTGWSAYFDGSGDYLSIPANAAFSFGTGNFTYEMWVFLTSYGNSGNFSFFCGAGGSGQADQFMLNNTNNGRFLYYDGASSAVSSDDDAGKIPLNTWTHIAACRSGSTLKLFKNGVEVVSTTSTISITIGATNTFYIGNRVGGAESPQQSLFGYISNLRVLKGTALYTTTFTPPTSALTNIANTSLLICQSNRFIDNSTNAFTLTRAGDVSIQAFSPFAPTASYSTANVGGSVYLDGSGDYLSITNNAALQMGSGDFTIEYWWYPNNITGYQTPYDKGYTNAGGLVLQTGSGDGRIIVYASGTGVITSNTAVVPNSWTHMALVRNGTNLTLYQNGISVGSATNSTNFNDANTTSIGANILGATQYPINGYLSNFRIVKGTAVYTAAFTPPTAPLTNIANTSLLCNFTNGQIIDQTAKNVLETVGDAKVSTAQYKYGTGSISFDGTGDAVLVKRANESLKFGSGNFTIEGWVYFNTVSARQVVFNQGWGSGSYASEGGFTLDMAGSSSGQLSLAIGTMNAGAFWLTTSASPAFTTGQWYHIALVRNGTTITIYRDGVSIGYGTLTSSTTKFANMGTFNLGTYDDGSLALNGYIDEVRLTKGYARYTSNFTAPTSAFKDR